MSLVSSLNYIHSNFTKKNTQLNYYIKTEEEVEEKKNVRHYPHVYRKLTRSSKKIAKVYNKL